MLLPRAKLATRISAWKEQLVMRCRYHRLVRVASPEIPAAAAGRAVGSPCPPPRAQRAGITGHVQLSGRQPSSFEAACSVPPPAWKKRLQPSAAKGTLILTAPHSAGELIITKSHFPSKQRELSDECLAASAETHRLMLSPSPSLSSSKCLSAGLFLL